MQNNQEFQDHGFVPLQNETQILTSVIQNLAPKIQELRCSQGNLHFLICCDKNCQSQAVFCGDYKCKCQQNHKNKCNQNFRPERAQKMAEEKHKRQKQIGTQFDIIFDNLIDQISTIRQKTIKSLQYLIFQPHQISFLKMVTNSEQNKVQGKNLNEYYQSFRNPTNIEEQQRLKQICIKMLKNECNQCVSKLQFFEASVRSRQIKEYTDKFKLNDQCTIFQNNKWNSKIIDSLKEVQTLQSFIHTKKIKNLNLKYRASQNDFSTKKFYDLCKGVKNTLVLIETSKKVIIGGFTPHNWSKGNYLFQQNPNQRLNNPNETFIFSLTNKDKFTLLLNDKATFYFNQNWGPAFGEHEKPDLAICDRANQERKSYVFSQMLFRHSKYNKDSLSYQKFTGELDDKFLINEWQVMQVIFQ